MASSVLIPEMKLKMYMMMEVHKINLKNGKRKLVYSISNKRGLRERMGAEKWKIRWCARLIGGLFGHISGSVSSLHSTAGCTGCGPCALLRDSPERERRPLVTIRAAKSRTRSRQQQSCAKGRNFVRTSRVWSSASSWFTRTGRYVRSLMINRKNTH